MDIIYADRVISCFVIIYVQELYDEVGGSTCNFRLAKIQSIAIMVCLTV